MKSKSIWTASICCPPLYPLHRIISAMKVNLCATQRSDLVTGQKAMQNIGQDIQTTCFGSLRSSLRRLPPWRISALVQEY